MKKELICIPIIIAATAGTSWAMARRTVNLDEQAVEKSYKESLKNFKEGNGNQGTLYENKSLGADYLKELERQKQERKKIIEKEQKNILKKFPKGKTVIGL